MALLITGLLLIFVSYWFQTRHIVRQRLGSYSSVSDLYSYSYYRKTFKTGLTLTGALQMGWIVLLYDTWLAKSGEVGALGLFGVALFGSGAIGALLMAIWGIHERRYVHAFGVVLYFLGLTIGAGLLVAEFALHDLIFAGLSAIPLLLFMLALIIIARFPDKKVYYLEMTHVLCSYLWVLVTGIIMSI